MPGTTTDMDPLEPKWAALEAARGSSLRMTRGLPDKGLPVYVTYEPSTARRGIRIEVDPAEPISGLPDWREVEIRQDRRATALLMQMSLNNPAFRDVFTAVAADLLSALAGKPASDWPAILRQRVHAWTSFFREHGFQGLTQERQRGLFAELLLIRDTLRPAIGLAKAIDSWTGPRRDPHDFRLQGHDVEVKATTTDNPRRVKIHGASQLANAGLPLFLHVTVLEVGQGETLVAMVGGLRELARQEGCLQELNERLRLAGYLDIHEREYGTLLREVAQASYGVGPGFPSITEVPSAVENVSYVLALDGCNGHIDPQPPYRKGGSP